VCVCVCAGVDWGTGKHGVEEALVN